MTTTIPRRSEEWRPIDGSDVYEVSNLGRIRSWQRGRYPSLLKFQHHNRGGYPTVKLSNQKRMLVHRLVCEAFNGEPPEGKPLVRHLDGNPMNNRADNLAWGDCRDNAADAVRHGRTTRGERSHHAKLTEAQAAEIKGRLQRGERSYIIARDYPQITAANIRAIRRGRAWAHVEAGARPAGGGAGE